MKSSIVESIIKKICNISLSSINNSTHEEKVVMLSDIEKKLKASALALGSDGRMYTKIIMHSLKYMLFNDSKEHEDVTVVDQDLPTTTVVAIRRKNYDIVTTHSTKTTEKRDKGKIIQSIVSGVQSLAQKLAKENNLSKDMKSLIDHLKKTIKNLLKKKKKGGKPLNENLYTDIIAAGVNLMIKNNSKQTFLEETRRNNKDVKDSAEIKSDIKRKNFLLRNTTPFTKPRKVNTKCKYAIDKACSEIRSMQNYICRYDKAEIPLDRLCNRINDCLDKSDEKNCVKTAVERIKGTGDIINSLEISISNKCISSDISSSIFTTQNQILHNVLKSHLIFFKSDTSSWPKYDSDFNNDTVRKISNEAALVVSSLVMAIEGSLCARRFGLSNIDEIAIRHSDDSDPDEALDEVLKTASWSPNSCVCNGPVCRHYDCPALCKRLCWQRYSLKRWTCHAIDEGPSIPLDYLCDGKYDCYDETDELDCSTGEYYGKFDSSVIYKNILKNIGIKTKSKKYGFVLTELLTLHETVALLQKLGLESNLETMNVKIVRDQCFSTISDIYERSTLMVTNIVQLNEIYDYLMTLNRMLVDAMKRSRTGNERIIPTEGCMCKGTRCVLLRCSESCKRTCTVQHKFTKYSCNRKMNQFIPVEKVCDGLPDCPDDEDENDCQKEVCRIHHLVLLRHNIQNVGHKHRGTALGEALDAWKTKVTNALLITERNGRPNRKTLEDVVANMLQDLLKTYATLENYRRGATNNNLKEFVNISQQLIKILKSCWN
uniref:Uncharacterized protein n=2 Tax=Bombyx mori TaxID=7091 RepID=A0A8R2GCU5_BOMMO|nr:uncharacterized protein LOC101745994 [Bombyx mori]